MATYNNRHWLLCHIRNSCISTDDTGMCEAVMLSDDLAKQFLKRGQKKSEEPTTENGLRTEDLGKYICYPGLDQSDDEDMDPASQSFDIQMYPEIGSHRYRSNTAQKLEKMNLARRKAARIRNIKFDENIAQETTNNTTDLFKRKDLKRVERGDAVAECKSRLSEQLILCPKQPQNKFLQYARFDGTSQTGIATKNLSIFLTMLPENLRNYPMKICVAGTAKIEEVIGYICYKCSIQNAEIPLQSIRNYGLYITEEDGEIYMDLPPLDLREPCSKFGFTHLTLTVRKPLAHVTSIEFRSPSMISETEAAVDAAVADTHDISNSHSDVDMALMLGHNSKIEAPLYKTYRLNLIRGLFKTEVQLGISGERIEIDPVQQNTKFFKVRAVSYTIESIAYCEVFELKQEKAHIRLWYVSSGSHNKNLSNLQPMVPSASQSYLVGNVSSSSPLHAHTPPPADHFKHYEFETHLHIAKEINSKINFLLEVRSSAMRREFLIVKEKHRDRQLIAKKVFGK